MQVKVTKIIKYSYNKNCSLVVCNASK